ncbi:hypothetical protein AAZV13_13G017300 [Glycine max]
MLHLHPLIIPTITIHHRKSLYCLNILHLMTHWNIINHYWARVHLAFFDIVTNLTTFAIFGMRRYHRNHENQSHFYSYCYHDPPISLPCLSYFQHHCFGSCPFSQSLETDQEIHSHFCHSFSYDNLPHRLP